MVWNITTVGDSTRKQFSKEKGDKMSALPATVGRVSVDIPVGTVRPAMAIAELSGSDTVSITISLERLVSLTHNVACLVGQHLDEAVGQEKMSSDVELADGSGNRGGGAAPAALPVSPVEYEQGPLVGGPEVGYIYYVLTDFSFRMLDLRRLDKEVVPKRHSLHEVGMLQISEQIVSTQPCPQRWRLDSVFWGQAGRRSQQQG